MRCICYRQFGGADVLQLGEVPLPPPGPGDIRVRVAGCGVNPIDVKTRAGLGFVSQMLGAGFSFVPGYDASGVVDAIGEGVTAHVLGAPVFGMVNFPLPAGCYAEYVVAPAIQWAAAPTAMPLAHAGGLPLAGLTAWQALFEVGGLQANERVLVLAGAGGVGHLAVQLAAWKGAQVSATASPGNHAFLRDLGASQSLDYRTTAAIAGAGPWDLIVDLMGGSVGEQALAWLSPKGRMVTVPTNTAAALVQAGAAVGKTVHPIKVTPNPAQLEQLAALVNQGLLILQVSDVIRLEDAASAHVEIERGHVKGKLILVP